MHVKHWMYNAIRTCMSIFHIHVKYFCFLSDLDYDDGTFSYYFAVDVKDTVHVTRVFVMIRLLPVNEYRPAIVLLTKTISETTPIGSEIAEVGISDNDLFLDNVHQFSISSGNCLMILAQWPAYAYMVQALYIPHNHNAVKYIYVTTVTTCKWKRFLGYKVLTRTN